MTFLILLGKLTFFSCRKILLPLPHQGAEASPGDGSPGPAVMHAVIHRPAVAAAAALGTEAAEQRRAQLLLENHGTMKVAQVVGEVICIVYNICMLWTKVDSFAFSRVSIFPINIRGKHLASRQKKN